MAMPKTTFSSPTLDDQLAILAEERKNYRKRRKINHFQGNVEKLTHKYVMVRFFQPIDPIT
jgi:hypothetical protein